MQANVSIISFVTDEAVSKEIARILNVVYTIAEIHRFPDDECCIRIQPEHISKRVIVVCSLYHPDQLVLPLLFLADTLRDYGAEKIVLVAPYLAYMRQDKRFREGEGISARYFARLISGYFDALITVDPHLHRIKSLDEIYTIPSRLIHAAPVVAEWIHKNITNPLLIGPDSESEQWVKSLAQLSQAPYIVLEKIRHGDRDVEIIVPGNQHWMEHTPVLFDDIISTGRTMIETIRHLKHAGLPAPVCIGIHGVFSENAWRDLLSAGAANIVTTNTIPNPGNIINLTSAMGKVLDEVFTLLGQG